MKKKKWNKTRKKSRYGKYYETIMQPIWRERWDQELKRIIKLKKQLLKLGPIPEKEVQLIKTANLFVNLIDLLTSFIDKGPVQYAPDDKFEAACRLNDHIIHYIAREEDLLCYINKADIGQTVTANNLYLGVFSSIAEEDITDKIKTKTVKGITVQVIADFSPLIDWINQTAVTLDGYPAKISQKALASYIKDIKDAVLKEIDSILN